MKKTDIALGVGAVLLGAMVVLYLQLRQEQPQAPELPAVVEPPPPPAAPEPPPVHYPVAPAPNAEQQAPTAPAATSPPPAAPPATQPGPAETAPVLPALDASDAPLKNDLGRVLGAQSLDVLFHTDALIRRLVVSVDNLPGKQFPRSGYRLARSTPGLLVVDRAGEGDDDERIYLSPRNFARYTPFVSAVEHLDIDALVAIYRRYYPLVQQVYENLGYPASAYFNDRLVEVIDQLLDTPDIDRPVRLVQPHVLYKYADPQLEALSAGQKVLIRVGPDNAHKLKAKLRTLRTALVSLGSGG